MDPNAGPNQHNQQVNQSNGKGPFYANQGTQKINNYTNAVAKSWAGWATLILVVVDVAFFFYGKEAYTGLSDSSGDMWRAGIFFVLLVITLRMIRRWVRHRG